MTRLNESALLWVQLKSTSDLLHIIWHRVTGVFKGVTTACSKQHRLTTLVVLSYPSFHFLPLPSPASSFPSLKRSCAFFTTETLSLRPTGAWIGVSSWKPDILPATISFCKYVADFMHCQPVSSVFEVPVLLWGAAMHDSVGGFNLNYTPTVYVRRTRDGHSTIWRWLTLFGCRLVQGVFFFLCMETECFAKWAVTERALLLSCLSYKQVSCQK